MRFRAPRAQNLREAYLARLAAQREAVRAACARRGWDLALHRTDQSAAGALLSLTRGSPSAGRPTSRGAPDDAGLSPRLRRSRRARRAAGVWRRSISSCGSRRRGRGRKSFPPLRLLLGLVDKDATPAKTPWPLLLLQIGDRRGGRARDGGTDLERGQGRGGRFRRAAGDRRRRLARGAELGSPHRRGARGDDRGDARGPPRRAGADLARRPRNRAARRHKFRR